MQERSLLEGGVGRSRQPGRGTSARVPYDVFGILFSGGAKTESIWGRENARIVWQVKISGRSE